MARNDRTRPASEQTDDEILERCILALDQGDPTAIDAILAQFPDREQGLREQLKSLEQFGILRAPDKLAGVPERLGEFKLLAQLGRGGMGVVFAARQESLQREVALKLIHPDQMYFPGARERFQREVLAVARLRHPGIVPVYTFGEHEGIPYYAMERLAGASLTEVLHALAGTAPSALDGAAWKTGLARVLHGKGTPQPIADNERFAGTWVTACCRIVRDVAVAIAHAHQHGVLHRDLKPSNVMLTVEGRVLVIDFGLASAQGSQKLTRSHATFGSLPYMAPEQVRGEADKIDARTDVYALGVTLYELLTLTLPHGDGSGTTRERILAGSVTPPARHNAQIHADAEAICLLAMDPEPARRYQSVAELAAELDAFLAQRPVRARRPGLLLRTRRWISRHPARAVALLLGFVIVVPGPLLFAVQQHAAASELAATLHDLRAQEELARTNLERALEAVDKLLVRTAEHRLADVPRTAPLRRQLLEDAQAFHEDLVARNHDPLARAARARSSIEIGSLRGQLGDPHGAISKLREGIADLQQCLRGSGAAPARRTLALAHQRLAQTLSQIGQRAEAVAEADRSLVILQALLQDNPGDISLRLLAADSRRGRAGLLGHLQRLDEAMTELDALDRELDAGRMPAGTPEQHQRWLVMWSQVADAMAVLEVRRGDTLAAQQRFLTAIERLQRAAADGTPTVDLRVRLAEARERLAQIASQRQEWQQALPWIDAALADYEALAAAQPDAPDLQSRLAAMLGTRATARSHGSQLDDALADHDRSIAVLRGIVAGAADDGPHRQRLAIALAERGVFQREQKELEQAREDLGASVTEFERVLARDPGEPQTINNIVASLANLAQIEIDDDDLQMAKATMERAIAIARGARGGDADRSLIDVQIQAADIAARMHDTAAAIAHLTEAHAAAERWAAAKPDDPLRGGRVAAVALNLGTSYLQRRDFGSAIATWQQALPRARAAAAAGKTKFLRQVHALVLLRLCDAHERQGDLPRAREWFAAAIAETGITAAEVQDFPPLPALFDKPELREPPVRDGR